MGNIESQETSAQLEEENVEAFEQIVKDAQKIGTVTNDACIKINGETGVLVEGTVEEFR